MKITKRHYAIFYAIILIVGVCWACYTPKSQINSNKLPDKIIFITEEIAIEKSEREQFALYHFKYGITESDLKKIEKNDMINGVSKVSKSTIHVYKNVFYNWEDVSKIIVTINVDKPLKSVDTKF